MKAIFKYSDTGIEKTMDSKCALVLQRLGKGEIMNKVITAKPKNKGGRPVGSKTKKKKAKKKQTYNTKVLVAQGT